MNRACGFRRWHGKSSDFCSRMCQKLHALRRSTVLSIVVILPALLTACSLLRDKISSSQLYRVQQVGLQALAPVDPVRSWIYLEVDSKDSVLGFAGCNRFTALMLHNDRDVIFTSLKVENDSCEFKEIEDELIFLLRRPLSRMQVLGRDALVGVIGPDTVLVLVRQEDR